MVVYFAFFVFTLILWYWKEQKQFVSGMQAGSSVPKTEAFVFLWEKFKIAIPFLTDVVRLVLLPYFLQLMFQKIWNWIF